MNRLIITSLLAMCLAITGCGENAAEKHHRFEMEKLKLEQETILKKATIEANRDMEVAEDYSDAGMSANGQMIQSQGVSGGSTVNSGYSGTDMLLAAGVGAFAYDAFKSKPLDFPDYEPQYQATRSTDFNGQTECLDKHKKVISCAEADRRIAQSKKDKQAYVARKAEAEKQHKAKEATRKQQYNKNKKIAEAKHAQKVKEAQKGKAAGKQNSKGTAVKNCPKNTVLNTKTNKCQPKKAKKQQQQKQKPAAKKQKPKKHKKRKVACGKKNGKTVYCYK